MLNVAACFHRYSLSNVLLILTQRPDATRVAGIRTWNRLGRRVRKGERGIAILAPCTYRGEQPADDSGREPDQSPAEPPAGAAPRRVLRGFRIVHVFDVDQTDGDPIPDVQPVVEVEREALTEARDHLVEQLGEVRERAARFEGKAETLERALADLAARLDRAEALLARPWWRRLIG
jgi:antirestriction protein ArdC